MNGEEKREKMKSTHVFGCRPLFEPQSMALRDRDTAVQSMQLKARRAPHEMNSYEMSDCT